MMTPNVIAIKRYFSAITFIAATCALILITMQSPEWYPAYFGEFDLQQMPSVLYYIASSILFFFIVPYFIGTRFLNMSRPDMGMVFPAITKNNVLVFLLACISLIPFGYILTTMPSVQESYHRPHLDLEWFIFINIGLLPIYYFVEEYFFRGLMFLTLFRLVGWHSFWITDIIFTLSHLSKPVPEILLCIPASIILNFLTYRTGSFYPSLIVHYSLAMLTNIILWH